MKKGFSQSGQFIWVAFLTFHAPIEVSQRLEFIFVIKGVSKLNQNSIDFLGADSQRGVELDLARLTLIYKFEIPTRRFDLDLQNVPGVRVTFQKSL
ncbi:hypothetical protein CROQUDRAFT_103962 [Cronartium quercuum f. sp. fusiforme G11]|uniref:Uncharacterized protein n=1 Tax=Cronartium quercuum f. sp. fusiforme G11 TaxID=708437 RepID=A0A9P6THJ9_9BASI|nr:hypothetical protein CROQUDRAFT_103962 [Cronartium quercuum f. sp. fusiforme G11]